MSAMEEEYILITKLRDTHLNPYNVSELAVRGALKTSYPATYPNDAAVYALQDFTPPNAVDAAVYLAEGLAIVP